MAQKNSTILAKTWLEGTSDYQQRVPNPDQSTITQQMEAIFSPLNKNIYNQFLDTLVNRIGFTFVRQQSWKNPLAVFKNGKYNYGSTIQEIGVQWVKAHTYTDDNETLLKMHRPEVQAAYHTMNRQDQYPISITLPELRQAFTQEYGLNQLVAGVLQAPINSDEYDEFQIMKNLFAEYEKAWGFYKVHVDEPVDQTTSQELLTALQTYKGKLMFPSTLYNSGVVDIPVFARPEELVLFLTPESQANINVEGLATLFNLDKAEAKIHTVIIDELPIPNAVALLTTQDFFVCQDNVYENSSFYNPQTLTTNYYLTHWGTYSVSPFVPAILFTTDEGTVTPTTKMTPRSLEMSADSDAIAPGSTVQITLTLNGTLEPETDGIEIAPDSATYKITGATADGTGIQLNTRTYVDRLGKLHLQKSTVKPGDKITVTATSTYNNPSGANPTEPLTATHEFTVA